MYWLQNQSHAFWYLSVPHSPQEPWEHSEKWLLQLWEAPVLFMHIVCTPFCQCDSFMRTDPVISGQGASYRFTVIMKAATPKSRAAVMQAQGHCGCTCDTADAWWIGGWLLSDLPQRNTSWQPPRHHGRSNHGHSAPVDFGHSITSFCFFLWQVSIITLSSWSCFKRQIKKCLWKDYNNVWCCYALIQSIFKSLSEIPMSAISGNVDFKIRKI